MPKNIVEDIIAPQKRKSIRDIPIPDGRKKKFASEDLIRNSKNDSVSNGFSRSRNSLPTQVGSGKFGKKAWISIGIAAVIVIIAILSFFSGGNFAYVPKSASISFNHDVYTASKTGENALLFSVVKLSGEKSETVSASGEEQVSRKASGIIVVYNDASTVAQKLVANSRFEAANSKVYRIKDVISIPGKKTVNGVSQPGSVEVAVYADEAGESYNQNLTDFTLPGLKGSDRYKTIYARSKTSMAGGFVGMAKVVNEETLTKAKNELKTALETQLLTEARAQVPEDFVLPSTLSTLDYEDLPQVDAEGGGAIIGLKANFHGVMFKKIELSKHLASKKMELIESDVVEIEPLDSLSLSFFGNLPTDLLSANQVSFEVSGTSDLVWQTDEGALRADLIGKKKKDVESILSNYPSIASANATVRPFWKRSFPDEITDITVKRLPLR